MDGMEFERWMCKSAAGGKWNLSGPAAVRAVPILSRYRSPASVTEQDCRLSVIPGPGEPRCRLCLLTAQRPGIGNSRNDRPSLLAGRDGGSALHWDAPSAPPWVWALRYLGSLTTPPFLTVKPRLECASLCISVLAMVHSSKKWPAFLPFRLCLEGTVYFPHTPEISMECNHLADPHWSIPNITAL